MRKNYLAEKAVVSTGASTITVYGQTARLVNTVVSITVILACLALLSKTVK